jgi:uncharacterized membrane protein YphA (DoxX/SURF4 family)
MELFIFSFLVTIMFLLSGMIKINTFQSTIKSLMKRTKLNNNMALIAIIIAIAIEVICPLLIMYDAYTKNEKNKKNAKYSCYILAVFTITATLIYHYPPVGSNYYPFISNVTTLGALLLLAKQFN